MFLFRCSSILVLAQCCVICFVCNWLNIQVQGFTFQFPTLPPVAPVPSETTVRKARCIANCYTLYGHNNNDSERICETRACHECLLPCGKSFQNEALCISDCNNSSNCEASCKFITFVKSFSSLTGDGSKPPTPGTPTLRNRTFTSITLQWEPVNSTNGTPVYMVAMGYDGDGYRTPLFFNRVLTVPRITISTSTLCAGVSKHGGQSSGFGTPRYRFDGIFYKYRVAVVTENSSVIIGTETKGNLIPFVPKPVSNVTVSSIKYDGSQQFQDNPKLKVTVVWKQLGEEDKNVVSNYAIVWSPKCSSTGFPQSTITNGPNTSGIIYIDETIYDKCKQVLTVFALNNCLVGNGTTLIFEYPGCANITDFPKKVCYKYDPPDSPPEDRKVRNASYRLSSINHDYTFNVNATWDPPRYPYKNVSFVHLRWQKVLKGFDDSFPRFLHLQFQNTSAILGPLEPAQEYLVRIVPFFADDKPSGVMINFTMRTPEVDPAQVTPHDLTLDDFVFSPENKTFQLNITWKTPSFNYSNLSAYAFSYQVNEGAVVSGSTNKTYFYISGIVHGAPVTLNVTSQYVHRWIRGKTVQGKATAPAPGPDKVKVQNLILNRFTFSPQTGTFDLNITWEKPLFNYSIITIYVIKFRAHGRSEISSKTNLTYFIVHGCNFGEPVELSVAAYFMNSRILTVENDGKTRAPLPDADDVKVQNFNVRSSKEDEESNTFAVDLTWDRPPFKYRDVMYYNLSYEITSLLRNQFPCSSLLVNTRCTISGLNDTLFQISGILPQEHIKIQVTPVYDDRFIKGQPSKNQEYSAPAPRGKLLTVVGLRHDGLVRTSSGSFRTKVRWEKPLFTHSNVSHYTYKIVKKNEEKMQRRSISFNTVNTTTITTVLIDGIKLNEEIEFQVTPVFVVHTVMGIEAKLPILKEPIEPAASKGMTPGEISGLAIGLLLLAVICLIIICCLWRERKTRKEQGLVSGKSGLMIDHWEVDGDLVALEDEIGEGAFGKVYRGTLKEVASASQKILLKSSKKGSRTINGSETYVVAVKMLQDMSDSDQRREFLDEIQLMKTVGSHRNIVNMVGCCTVVEPMFLLVEYVPNGDLLHYLRKHRGKVKGSLGEEISGPYRSTYCETYFTDANSTGISIKTCKDDRVYVNAPWMSKEDGAIELLSFNSSTKPGDQIQTMQENRGLDMEEEEKETESDEEILTPGDLMAFAWQITQGMEYLAKKGFVHRDLAARNVLVGEKKIAKVADFGLTRHVYEGKAYQAKRSRKLPLKWMSIEAIFDQTFTTQSDVWAFGVLLWEIVTLGGSPYPTIDNKELLHVLKDGYRMEKPDTCSDELYDMMQDCWQEKPGKRSTFTQLRESLETIMQKDNPYLDLTAVDESCAYYNVPSFNSVTDESTDNDECDDEVEVVVEETDEIPKKSMTEKDPHFITQSVDVDNNIENQPTENSQRAKDSAQDPLDIIINLNTLERGTYRRTAQGLTF